MLTVDVFDALTLVHAQKVPGSTEVGTGHLLSALHGRAVMRGEWVDAVEGARYALLAAHPDLLGVPFPKKEDVGTEWRLAVLAHFGPALAVRPIDQSREAG